MGARFSVHIAGRSSAIAGNHGHALTDGECTPCDLGTPYASDKIALDHIHAVHGSCGVNSERPHEDPCYVWLHQVTVGPRPTTSDQDPTNEAMNMVEDFLALLSQVFQVLTDLRNLASRKRKGPSAGEGFSQPLLPPSIIRAFQHLMEMFILRSHALSLKNKMITLSDSSSPSVNYSSDARRVSELLRWEKMAYDNVRGHINTARQKVILADDSSTKMTTLGIEQVVIQFLMCVFIGNVQNRSPTVKLPPQSMHSHGTCLDLYQAYIARLRFQCYHRPQRRVFLDIYSFEEELMALQSLLSAQRKLLETYNLLMSSVATGFMPAYPPASWVLGNTEFIRQVSQVEQQGAELKMLQDKCSALKEQVKQAIEVIEENHGKAIRVFTIVTLFFLPLSFVSTFLGMNTTDVDGLKWDQSIFWITSLPITAMVLILALLYGYKGDEMSDWFRSKTKTKQLWDSYQRPAHETERKAIFTGGKSFSGIIRRPTTDSLGIDI